MICQGAEKEDEFCEEEEIYTDSSTFLKVSITRVQFSAFSVYVQIPGKNHLCIKETRSDILYIKVYFVWMEDGIRLFK